MNTKNRNQTKINDCLPSQTNRYLLITRYQNRKEAQTRENVVGNTDSTRTCYGIMF